MFLLIIHVAHCQLPRKKKEKKKIKMTVRSRHRDEWDGRLEKVPRLREE